MRRDDPPQPESLDERYADVKLKLAQAKRELGAWDSLAANQNLSREAALHAKGMARSYRAAASLYEKKLAHIESEKLQASLLPSSRDHGAKDT